MHVCRAEMLISAANKLRASVSRTFQFINVTAKSQLTIDVAVNWCNLRSKARSVQTRVEAAARRVLCAISAGGFGFYSQRF